MRVPVFTIETPAAGRLATMAHPRGGSRLRPELDRLRAAGVDVLVSALTEQEYGYLGLIDEGSVAAEAGLEFVSHPIEDTGTPLRMEPVLELSSRLAAQLGQGRFLVAHCWAGIGRSSMLAGSVLVRLGVAPEEAWRRIRAARGLTVPDNLVQERWLYEFAEAASA